MQHPLVKSAINSYLEVKRVGFITPMYKMGFVNVLRQQRHRLVVETTDRYSITNDHGWSITLAGDTHRITFS
jgi:hypothetical protein